MNLRILFLFFCALGSSAYAGGQPLEFRMRLSELPRHHERHFASSLPPVYPNEFRTIDGSGNNPIEPLRGAAGTTLRRIEGQDYADGSGSPVGAGQKFMKSARAVSNLVVAQDHLVPNSRRTSDYLWQWGQFIDHDLDLTPSVSPVELFNIPVPTGDPHFDPMSTGGQTIELDRSLCQLVNGVRQQINVNTAFIDASQVYGSDVPRARELRTLDGTGRMKTSEGNLLPYNVHGFPNVPDSSPSLFLAGDVRSNEQVCLTVMHTLFVREHNYWAGVIRQSDPALDDDGIYFRARAIVGAEIQIITYRDFLPLLLGPNAIPPYTGYHPEVDPTIENAFSTAAFRVGHTLLSPTLRRLNSQNVSIGDLSLAASFFNVPEVTGPGIEPYLRGLAGQVDQEVDSYIVDPVRNFLFGPPGAGGFDLAALNIQRGRDHGVPRYNIVRSAFGLAPKANFQAITSDAALQAKFASAYDSAAGVDLWVGALAEDHAPGAMVGETIYTILRDQFTRSRDGDRFWYQTYLPANMVAMLESQPLSAIIKRNTSIGSELRENVFVVDTAK